jgi:hypothetical protein
MFFDASGFAKPVVEVGERNQTGNVGSALETSLNSLLGWQSYKSLFLIFH